MGHAIFEQKSGILGVAVASACGVVSAGQLKAMSKLAETITIHGIKMTTRQTMVFLINKDSLETFKEAIEAMGLKIGVFGNVVRNVKGCAGNEKLCPRSQGNAFDLGVRIQDTFMNQPSPKDFKISTAGCVRCCTDPYCADFGVVAVGKDAYDIYIGGRGGSKMPRHGTCILKGISSEQVLLALEHVLENYRSLANPDERLCKVIDRCGVDIFIMKLAAAAEPAIDDDFLSFLDEKKEA